MLMSPHFYVVGSFISPKEFSQVIVTLYYIPMINKKVPGCFILINSKYYLAYKQAFSYFRNIISNNEKNKLNLVSITIDFDEGLIKALREVFPNVRPIGSLFHYTDSLRRNAEVHGLLKANNKEVSSILLKDLSTLPWKYSINNNIINEIFNKYDKNSKKNTSLNTLIN